MKLKVKFYASLSGREPVREWLRSLSRKDRKTIGDDIKTAQFGWPLGMPLIRKFDKDLWEVRSNLDNRIARTLFTVEGDLMVLLHGFVKKSQKTPHKELSIALKRLAMLRK